MATQQLDEEIISQVRRHSCLYDPREAEYKDADRKAAVWREMATRLGISAIECEHRWRYLRDRYTRERKRKRQGQAAHKVDWPLAQHMHFIQDFIKHRRARGLGATARNHRNQQERHMKVEQIDEASCSDESGGQSSPDASEFPVVVMEQSAQCPPVAATPELPNDRSRYHDEDELFCLSVAHTLKRLPAQQRSLAKVKILQLIHQLEFAS